MKKARVVVTIKQEVLDPAGVAVKNALLRQGITELSEVRIGKVIDIVLNDRAAPADRERLVAIAREILSNPIMEDVSVELSDEMRDDQY